MKGMAKALFSCLFCFDHTPLLAHPLLPKLKVFLQTPYVPLKKE